MKWLLSISSILYIHATRGSACASIKIILQTCKSCKYIKSGPKKKKKENVISTLIICQVEKKKKKKKELAHAKSSLGKYYIYIIIYFNLFSKICGPREAFIGNEEQLFILYITN
jgi:hypothetical protein